MSSFKETKEVIHVAFAIAAVLVPVIKAQKALGQKLEDSAAGLLSDEVVAALKLAVEGADQLDEEIEGAGLFDGIGLAQFALSELKALKAKLAKPV